MQCHAFGLGLDHSCVAINVDDEAGQSIALGMDETETVGMRIVGESHRLTHLVGLVETLKEKPLVNLAIVKTQNFHGDAV